MTTTAVKELIGMPNLPITKGLMETSKKAPKGYVGAAEAGPAIEELRGAEATAEQKVGESGIAVEEAKRQEKAREAEQRGALATRMGEEIKALPERERLNQARDEFGTMTFVPSKDTAQDLASVFSLINVIGFVVGKSNAQLAMNAMNGMAEGYQKGKSDIYRKEKDEFDKNFKVMQAKIQTLEKELDEAIKLKQYDKDAGEQAITVALAKSESPLLKAMQQSQGDIAVLNSVKGARKDLDTVIGLQNKVQEAADKNRLSEERLALQKELATLKSQNATGARQQQFIVQRAVNSLGGVASAVEGINRLPTGTTTGVLPNLQTKDGMVNAMRNFAGRKVSSAESKSMETLFTGITRNLASIEASGAATGLVGLASQIEKLRPVAGDTAFDVALKMADIRRIATENMLPLIQSGLMPPQQAQVANGLVQRIETAIPYTTQDVVNALSTKGKQTLGEAGTAIGEKGRSAEEKARRLKELEEKERGSNP
jgi:hypothetical protein